jgi:hypothetical protein
MVEKYGIFLLNGTNHGYGTTPAIGVTKLHIGDFDTVEEAAEYIRRHPITPAHFIMQFWIEG